MIEVITDETAAIACANNRLSRDLFIRDGWGPVAVAVYQTQEVRCGWICEWNSADKAIAGAARNPLMVNRWTGDVVTLPLAQFPNVEASVRYYESQLPQEQQNAANIYWHLALNSPVRFNPALLKLGNFPTFADIPDIWLEITAYKRFLIKHRMEYPTVKAAHPGIRLLALENVTDGGNITIARYRILFDRDAVRSRDGSLGNKISLHFPPGSIDTLDDKGAGEYWIYTHGNVLELSH